jgi:hypothetical protein
MASDEVKRLRMDCKATGHLGDVSRGGLTRGDYRACDHDLGLKEKYIPCGIVDEDWTLAFFAVLRWLTQKTL